MFAALFWLRLETALTKKYFGLRLYYIAEGVPFLVQDIIVRTKNMFYCNFEGKIKFIIFEDEYVIRQKYIFDCNFVFGINIIPRQN